MKLNTVGHANIYFMYVGYSRIFEEKDVEMERVQLEHIICLDIKNTAFGIDVVDSSNSA